MTEQLTSMLLSLFACEAMATERLLSYDEAQGCASVYEWVKQDVADGDYAAYQVWKVANQEELDVLRAQAAENLISR